MSREIRCETAQTMETRYERARDLLRGAYSDQVVFNDVVYPTWIDDTDSFWYIRVIKEDIGVSHEVRIVDANEKTNRLKRGGELLRRSVWIQSVVGVDVHVT